MEVELKRTQLDYYEPVLETTVYREETMEMIVPDSCPDIGGIIDTESRACLRQRELSEGSVSLRGTAKTTVLYLPDGMEGLWKLEVEVPFQCVAEHPALTSRCRLMAVPRVVSAETRAINPRKVLVRINLAVELQAWQPQSLGLCCDIQGEESWGIQQKLENQEGSFVVCVAEKEFSFSDELTVPGSKSPVSEVLKGRGEVCCSESRLIGNKLIFNGRVMLQLLCRGTDAVLYQNTYELPFSQIMEVSGAEEDAACQLEVSLTDWSFAPMGEEGRALSVSLELSAQAVIRQNRAISLITDAYSTRHVLRAEPQSYQFWRLQEQGSRRQTVREIVETGVMPGLVHDAWMAVTNQSVAREGGHLCLTATVAVTVLYAAEEQEFVTVSRQFPVTCQLDCADSCQVSCACSGSELQATATAGGIEVRFAVDFRLLVLEPVRVSGISSVALEETACRELAEMPSIVLRQMTGQEGLWDIAKAYFTTIEEIMRANDLTDEDVAVGQLLLIPKKR